MKLERVEGSDTNVTYRLTGAMAKHIAVVARECDKTQSRYIADLVDRARVGIDIDELARRIHTISAAPYMGVEAIQKATVAIYTLLGD